MTRIDTIYIARHGFRLNWVTMNWKSVTGLPRDPPLAAYGETQAKEMAQYFLSLPEDERPTTIFSSPYYRCLQTSAPTSEALGVPIFAEHGLSEWYSPVQEGSGLHPRPASAESLRTHFPQIDASWSSIWYPTRRGETVAEAHERAGGCVGALVSHIERTHPGHRRILLVSHAATCIALTHELVGDRALPLRVGCCSLTELRRRSDGDGILGAWDPIRLATGDHLAEGAARDWGFEDIVIKDGKVIADEGVPGTENEQDHPVGLQSRHLTTQARI